MDTYDLGEMHVPVQERFKSDERFGRAFEMLGLPAEWKGRVEMPWWNEVAAGELEHSIGPGGIRVTLGPRHSYETQLVRNGCRLPVRSVSVGGIILSSDGHVAVGLRGGKSYPNTYHINAGALQITGGLRSGGQAVYDVFRATELEPEFGVHDSDIVDGTIHSRVMDYAIERGPMYVFLVRTRLPRDELKRRWESNPDVDRKEHREVAFIHADPPCVNGFIRSNYMGVCGSRHDRGDDERRLLHPGALALASFSGMPLGELRMLYREGVH